MFFCRLDRHEIGDFTYPLKREEARDQDIGFRQIVLLVRKIGCGVWCNAEEAAFVSI